MNSSGIPDIDSLIEAFGNADARDPRNAAVGMFLAYDGPEVHLDVPTDSFVWFGSVEDALGFLRDVLPYCSFVLGDLEPNPEAEILSGRISAVANRWELPAVVDDVNAILVGKWKVLWAGPFSLDLSPR
jgi:hypothetical protein